VIPIPAATNQFQTCNAWKPGGWTRYFRRQRPVFSASGVPLHFDRRLQRAV